MVSARSRRRAERPGIDRQSRFVAGVEWRLCFGDNHSAAAGHGPGGSPQELQTLALIYGLRGNLAEAARLNRLDLDDASVEHNLAYYATLRELSPEARSRAILSAGGSATS